MTFQEIITEVTNRLHETSSDLVTRTKTWVNLAYQDIQNRQVWPWRVRSSTLRTTSGTQDYGLSGEVDQIVSIRDADNEAKLTELSWQDFDDLVPNPTDTSNPTVYIPNGTWGVKDQLGVTASTIALDSTSSSDTAVSVVVYGQRRGTDGSEQVPLNGTVTTATVATFSRVDRIVKVGTSVGVIRAYAVTQSSGLSCTFSTIPPNEFATDYAHVAVYPMGAATLSYRYTKKILPMVQTADVPELPVRWHETIVLGALVRGLQFMNHQTYPLAKQEYEMMIEQMIRHQMPTADYLPRLESDVWPKSRPLVRIPRTA